MKLQNIVPKIRLKITKADGTEQSIVSRKKRKISSLIVREPATEWMLEVIYGPNIFNSGTFRSKEQARKALSDWTDEKQIKFIEDGEW